MFEIDKLILHFSGILYVTEAGWLRQRLQYLWLANLYLVLYLDL